MVTLAFNTITVYFMQVEVFNLLAIAWFQAEKD